MAIHTKLAELLQKAGLSEKECLVYIELLKKPVFSKWEVVTSTGFSKNAVYRAFDRLQALKLIKFENNTFKASSLKSLVAELNNSSRRQTKLANQLKNIAPFLRLPNENITDFETLYTNEQILNAYMFMAEHDYDVNIEFGDFENFSRSLGSLENNKKFREKRIKHASSHAICTTSGPRHNYFANPESQKQSNLVVGMLKLDYKGNYIIFSDKSDYVMFNNFGEKGNEHSILVKSKTIADAQRSQFACFSQLVGKM